MSLVSSIEWEACLLEPRPDAELKRRVERESGYAPGSLIYFTPVPELAQAIGRLNLGVRSRTFLDAEVRDLAGLVVSQDNSCRFCFAYQRAMMRSLGFSEQRIEAVEHGFSGADVTTQQRAALDFARKVSRSNPLPVETDKQRLREAGYSEMQILELVAHVGLFVYHNRVATMPALPSRWIEGMPQKWWARWFRPVLGFYMQRIQPRVPETRLTAGQADGPFSEFVRAFDGLLFAVTLREAIDVVLRDGALTGRAKLMIFAVVARALGCEASEAESRQLLSDVHEMRSEAVESLLAHLTAPELTEAESLVVAFARDTVWYDQPTPIQRRARELRDRMTREQFLEAIFAISVANMVCRLGIALPPSAAP